MDKDKLKTAKNELLRVRNYIVNGEISGAISDACAAIDEALADPYQRFKDALAAGNRVRYSHNHQHPKWFTKDNPPLWNGNVNCYEIEHNPDLFCGHTEEQWQKVVDGEFYVKVSDISVDAAKTSEAMLHLSRFSVSEFPFGVRRATWKYCNIVREVGHKQPAFGRVVDDDALVVVESPFKSECESLIKAKGIDESKHDWFIEL